VTSTLEIPPLGSLRQEDHELKATLSYIVKPCFKASKIKKKKKKKERERERERERVKLDFNKIKRFIKSWVLVAHTCNLDTQRAEIRKIKI
jgi:hypothetical protein